VAAQIDEKIDLMHTDQSRDFIVGKRMHVVPLIEQRRNAASQAIVNKAGKVANYFELSPIVIVQDRLDIMSHDVGAKIRRDVTYSKSTVWIRFVPVRALKREKRPLEALRKFAVLVVDLLRRKIVHAHHAKKEILKCDDRIPVMLDCEFVMPDGVQMPCLIAEDIGQSVMRFCGGGAYL
jgi:hypothetical protein